MGHEPKDYRRDDGTRISGITEIIRDMHREATA